MDNEDYDNRYVYIQTHCPHLDRHTCGERTLWLQEIRFGINALTLISSSTHFSHDMGYVLYKTTLCHIVHRMSYKNW